MESVAEQNYSVIMKRVLIDGKGNMELDILDYYKNWLISGRGAGRKRGGRLKDCRKPNHDIIAIANGHVSSRTIGAPITDFTLSVLANEEWKEKGLRGELQEGGA